MHFLHLCLGSSVHWMFMLKIKTSYLKTSLMIWCKWCMTRVFTLNKKKVTFHYKHIEKNQDTINCPFAASCQFTIVTLFYTVKPSYQSAGLALLDKMYFRVIRHLLPGTRGSHFRCIFLLLQRRTHNRRICTITLEQVWQQHEYLKCLTVKNSSPNISRARGVHSICFLW